MLSLVLDPFLRDYNVDEYNITKSDKDYDDTLYICKKIKDILQNNYIKVTLTRTNKNSISVEKKFNIINKAKADLILSLEISDLINVKNSEVEVYYDTYNEEIEYLSKSLCDNISLKVGLNNKGIKKNFLYSIKDSKIPTIVIKFNVCNNEYITENFKNIISEEIKYSIEDYFSINWGNKEGKIISGDLNEVTKILSKTNIDKNQAKTWAKNKGATNNFISLADIYWDMCEKCGGVNPVVAYAQAAYETAYGNFLGDLKEEFKNVCGFKNELRKRDEGKASYIKFFNWSDSIEAHLDHLALYAGAVGYPKEKTKDPKHLSYLYKTAIYVEDLSRNWSPKADYGIKISNLCKEMYKTTTMQGIENIKMKKSKELEIITLENIESFKEKLKNVNSILDTLKNYNNSLYEFLEKIEIYLENIENKKVNLENDNSELNNQIDKNKQLVCNMKELLKRITE
ncbi:N-acetylmuramoyl-L-alanine amidase [Clostridium tarantellae]|uniref:Uncharacterized protein n=1 Tax=Clostridium tarantellae TaxID=39493 RepID=A0A6I1MKL1_9CLOT|nr:N-acetylmuramoyl-L-alanine amidase [Clostridium tarantellae]MPQ43253.1 hypothetical protein [Clostridium tarantellae]